MAEAPAEDRAVILFDGVCNLCSGFVQFILPRDTDGRFAFASLQSDVAQDLLEDQPVDPDALESIVLLEDGAVYVKSDAVLRIAATIGGVYRLLWPFRMLPRRFRNWCYELVATHRYRLFGKKDRCELPDVDESLEDRFLE